jgi:hypothetical protein
MLFLLWAVVPCVTQAATPEIVSQSTASMTDECRKDGGTPSLSRGYETAVDLNGDGQPDYILDGNRLTCHGAPSIFCGSGGCVSEIYVSGPSGYRRAFQDNVFGFTIDRSTRPPTLTVDWHGFHCNRSGAEGCRQRLIWNGHEFVATGAPAHPSTATQAKPSVPASR